MNAHAIQYLAIGTIFLMAFVGAVLPLVFGLRHEKLLLFGQLFAGGGAHRHEIIVRVMIPAVFIAVALCDMLPDAQNDLNRDMWAHVLSVGGFLIILTVELSAKAYLESRLITPIHSP